MDLVSAISGMQQSSVLSNIDVAVAGKMLQSQRQQGNAALELLQSAGNLTSGAGNAVVGAAVKGLGEQVDTYA